MTGEPFDVVCVGGGIAGSGLATVLARAGRRCLVLEATESFPDRTKGEWIAPWGVAEAQRVGLSDDLLRAGGHTLTRHISYDETKDPAAAEAATLNLVGLAPGLPGPLTLRHPDACEALFGAAAAAGAVTLRSVSVVSVAAGASPTVAFVHDGTRHEVSARLVVGADGRGSTVRRGLGLELQRDAPHHLFSGLLVEGAHDWPADLQTAGTEGDVHFLAFPQGRGRVRLYLGWALDDRHRLAGPDGPRRFLDAFGRLSCVPMAAALAAGEPVSPCATYPNEDAWLDHPVAEGVVLVGDAAGWNDPITGQGLSIALRDIRLVAELLAGSARWSAEALHPYVEERRERLRRLRFAAALTARLANEFGPAARARRTLVRARLAQRPELDLARSILFLGPEKAPSEAFTPQRWDEILA